MSEQAQHDWTWTSPEPPPAPVYDYTWMFPGPPITDKEAKDQVRQLKKQLFIDALAEHPVIGKAIARAGVESRQTVYRWRGEDPQFADDWDRAIKAGYEHLEDTLRGRALDPLDKMSATLLMFTLKGNMPKYRDHNQINIHNAAVPVVDALQEAEDRDQTYVRATKPAKPETPGDPT